MRTNVAEAMGRRGAAGMERGMLKLSVVIFVQR